MSASAVIFYLLSAFILLSALLAVTTGKIFRSAIWLLFSLMGIAGLYFWLDLEFIAAIQIVVYVGGIVVLIIFSIFLTHQSGSEMSGPPVKRTVSSLLAAAFGFTFTYLLIRQHGFKSGPETFNLDVAQIGSQMLGNGEKGYALPFEVVSILLLSAMIGCIVIAMKAKKEE